MVRRSAGAEAAALAGQLPDLAVGLHIDLGEWMTDGTAWWSEGLVAPEDVPQEIDRQLAAFRKLVGDDPTHLDSHQHVHRDEPARAAVLSIGRRLGIPVRHFDPVVHYCGRFYGQDEQGTPYPELVTAKELVRLVSSLRQQTTELGCHPARGVPQGTTYSAERERELEALCDPAVRAAIKRHTVSLVSFADLKRRGAVSG